MVYSPRMPSPSFYPAALRLRWSCLLAASLLLGLVPALEAQNATPKPDLLADNGGFEKTQAPSENLWDGVDSNGTLAGFTFSPNVITEKGSFAPLAMPPSIAFVDLNGDGKPDLITADPAGFFRFYPTSGTAAKPAATAAASVMSSW